MVLLPLVSVGVSIVEWSLSIVLIFAIIVITTVVTVPRTKASSESPTIRSIESAGEGLIGVLGSSVSTTVVVIVSESIGWGRVRSKISAIIVSATVVSLIVLLEIGSTVVPLILIPIISVFEILTLTIVLVHDGIFDGVGKGLVSKSSLLALSFLLQINCLSCFHEKVLW